MTWVMLWGLVVGASLIIGRKRGAAAYARKRDVQATAEQLEQMYLILGILVSGCALVGLVASILSRSGR